MKNTTIAKILLSTFMIPSLMATASPLYAAPGDDAPQQVPTTLIEGQDAPGHATQVDSIEDYITNHTYNGVMDLSEIPVTEFRFFEDEILNRLDQDDIRSIKFSYRQVYDSITREYLIKGTIPDHPPRVFVKPSETIRVVSLRKASIQKNIFYKIMDGILSKMSKKKCNIDICFDYIMPFMPNPYNEKEILDVSSFYHTFFSKVNLISDSVLVYTNKDFNISEWIRCISGLFTDIRGNVSNYGGDILRCMFCKKGEENKKLPEDWKKSEEWKDFNISERLVKSRVPLENIVLCNIKEEEDLENLEDLGAFFVNKYACNNVLLGNSLNPAECENMPSVLNKSVKVRPCRLEPVYLTNVALYIPERGVKRNLECVSKHASIAFKNVKRAEIQPFLETKNVENIFTNLQTVFLTMRDLLQICNDVKLRTDFRNKLKANRIEKIVINDNKGDAYAYGPAKITTLVELDNIINECKMKGIKVLFNSLSVYNNCEIEKLVIQKAVELGTPLKYLYLSSILAENFISCFKEESQIRRLISSQETTIVLNEYNKDLANRIKAKLNPAAVVWCDRSRYIFSDNPWFETRKEALFYRKKSKFLDAIRSKNVPVTLWRQVFDRIEVKNATKEEIMAEFGKTIPEVSILFEEDDPINELKNFLEI